MYKPQNFARFRTVIFLLFGLSLLQSGCEKTDSVARYSAPKYEALQTSEFLTEYERTHPKPQRMIGVILPKGSVLWFFKLQGNVEAVASRELAIRNFLNSVKFSAANEPEWTVPEGWRQLPGNEMRHATLVLDGTPEIELAVSKLDARPDLPLIEQIVMNLNRWRGQLSFPPIDAEDLDYQSEKISIAGETGYWVSLVGRPKPKPAGMMAGPPVAKSNRNAEQASPPSSLVFDKPESWIEAPSTQFAKVSLRIPDGDLKVTVSAAGGDKLLNVNRWRGQVGLGPLTQEELVASVKTVPVGNLTGELYEMTEGGRAIVGVIVADQGQTWFVKMMGDAPLVERERSRFDGFLKSLQLRD